jgi:hypothetical protein
MKLKLGFFSLDATSSNTMNQISIPGSGWGGIGSLQSVLADPEDHPTSYPMGTLPEGKRYIRMPVLKNQKTGILNDILVGWVQKTKF